MCAMYFAGMFGSVGEK